MEVYLSLHSKQNEKFIKKNSVLINEAVHNHGVFLTEITHWLDSHVKNVNTLLNSAKTRERGVELLLALVPQCPQKVLAVQGERWFRFCSQIVNSVSGARSKVSACQVISIILRDLPYIPELQTSILSKQPAPLVVSLAAADSQWSCAALQCLYEYLKLSRGHCLPHKTVLEEHILGYLDNPLTRVGQNDNVSWAGRVFAALPLPGMGGSGAQGRAEARGRQLTQLLALSHSLMDYLFDGVVEKESYEHPREHTLHLPTVNSPIETSINPLQSHLAAMTRLVNSMKFIAEMITSDTNTTITFVPYDLLGAMFRLLQVEVSELQSYRSQEHKLLAFFMPSLHQHCLLILRDAVISIGESIDMYFGVIADLLLSTIKSSLMKNNPEWCTSGLQTRIIAYSVMATVIQVSHGKHTPSTELIRLILRDLVPRNQEVKLQNKQDGKLPSLSSQKNKSKKKGSTVISEDSSSQTGPTPCPEYFSCTARVALSLVKTLFTYATHSMTQKSQQLLQTSLMNVTSTVIGAARLPDLYMDGRTRAELYKTLASIATHPQPAFPPAYTMMMHLLQSGLHDPDILVVSACQAALGNLSFIIANPQICTISQAQGQQAQFNNDNDGEGNEELINATQEERIQTLLTSKKDEMNVVLEEEISEGEEERDEENEKGEQENEREEGKEEEEQQEEEQQEEGEEEQEGREEEQQRETVPNLEKDEEEITEDNKQVDAHEKDQLDKIHHARGNKYRQKRQRGLTTPIKGTAEEKNELPCKKTKQTNEESNGGPSLEEMLASFVDCGPDE